MSFCCRLRSFRGRCCHGLAPLLALVCFLSLGGWFSSSACHAQGHGVDAHAADQQHSDAEHADGAQDAQGEAAHGNTNPLSVDPDLMIFTLIIFLLTLLVLAKFAWGPIKEALERREQAIADQIAEAQKSRDEARRLLDQHEAKLAAAHDEIRSLMDVARREADAQKQSIVAEAEKIAVDQQARAVREINAAKNSALEELARSSVDQAVGLAGRIIGQKLKTEDHANLITEALNRLPSKN